MTRKDYYRYAKIFLLSLLGSVPVLIALNLLIAPHLVYWVLVTLNVVILITGFVIAVVIAEKRAKRIARKREEWVKAHPEEQPQQQNQPQKHKKRK